MYELLLLRIGIYKKKLNSNNEIERYKARLVAQGFNQRYGTDYLETFAPVVRYKSLKIILSLANKMDLEIHQFDVKTAYLNATMKEDVYMKQPPGFEVEDKSWYVN